MTLKTLAAIFIAIALSGCASTIYIREPCCNYPTLESCYDLPPSYEDHRVQTLYDNYERWGQPIYPPGTELYPYPTH